MLRNALRRLLKDEAMRVDMGHRARRYVLDHADSKACLGAIESFYLGVVARHQTTSGKQS